MRALSAASLILALSGCGGPPAVQVISTLKTALDTKCVAARLLDMDDICPQPKEPGPEPARYCYRTLGNVDCYDAPEADARRRSVVVASPAVEPAED
jgi:hypothetical protein